MGVPVPVQFEHHYSYHLLSTVDVPVPWSSSDGGQQQQQQVKVSFAVDDRGVLSFQVLSADDSTTSVGPHGSQTATGWSGRWASSELLLLLVCALLIATYVAVKLVLPPQDPLPGSGPVDL